MTTSPSEQFGELLEKFNTAMLITVTAEGRPHARPMVIAVRSGFASLELISRDDSGKIAEIEQNPLVTLTLQTESEFLTLDGKAQVQHDSERLQEVWQTSWNVWFPKGSKDPHLALIKIQPRSGEYWDLSGVNTLKFLFEAGKAMLQGKGEHEQLSTHGQVKLSS